MKRNQPAMNEYEMKINSEQRIRRAKQSSYVMGLILLAAFTMVAYGVWRGLQAFGLA